MNVELQKQIIQEEISIIKFLENAGYFSTFVFIGRDYFSISGNFTDNREYLQSKKAQLEDLEQEA